MADDVRISTALPRHPKTVKLVRRLHEQGAWALVCLFAWVADNRPDGNLLGMADEDIEIAAGWNGETGAFVSALAEVGFLDGEVGKRTIHDWVEHNPWAASRGQRVESAKRAASARWNALRMRPACDSHATRTEAQCSPPHPTPLDLLQAPPDSGGKHKLSGDGKKPSASPAGEAADQRHGPTRDLIQQLHREKFNCACIWDGSEGTALKRLLDSNRSWDQGQINAMVRNRFLTEGVTGDRPREWIPNLTRYAGGPLDRYGKNGGNGNGNHNRAEERQHSNLAALNSAFPLDR